MRHPVDIRGKTLQAFDDNITPATCRIKIINFNYAEHWEKCSLTVETRITSVEIPAYKIKIPFDINNQ